MDSSISLRPVMDARQCEVLPIGAILPAVLRLYHLDGHELCRHELDGHELDGHELDGHELDGHELDGHELCGHELRTNSAGTNLLAAIHRPTTVKRRGE